MFDLEVWATRFFDLQSGESFGNAAFLTEISHFRGSTDVSHQVSAKHWAEACVLVADQALQVQDDTNESLDWGLAKELLSLLVEKEKPCEALEVFTQLAVSDAQRAANLLSREREQRSKADPEVLEELKAGANGWARAVGADIPVAAVLSAVGLFRDLSWSLACPVYCGGSLVPFLGLGISIGLVFGFVLFLCALRAFGLRIAISALTEAIRDLTVAIAPVPAESDTASIGEWELLGEEVEDHKVRQDVDCLSVRHRPVEEGPGPTPNYCLDLAVRKLTGKFAGPSARCRRAFTAGFFAQKAVQCHTPYLREDPLPGFKLCHWVVLRCPAFTSPVHFTSRVDFGRAIEGGVEDSVFEAFASFTEVEIFCIGAGISIPRTGVWRSQQSGTPPATMAIPLQARSGGLLIAVPEPFLDNDALLDAAMESHDGVLGPSQEFTSDLVEEDDELNVVSLGRACSVIVVDVSDAAVPQMSEYDPVTHDFDSCLAFDSTRPASLPLITDVYEAIKAWLVSSSTAPRVHFYSAREEPEEVPQVKSIVLKKGPPKKITNQAIMDQLAALGSQMQVLASQQEELRRGVSLPSATPAVVPSGFMPLTSKMPSLSASLQVPAKPLASIAKALGPPPKTKTPDAAVVTGGVAVPAPDPTEVPDPSEPSMIVKAISEQSQALTALVAHLAGGDPMSELQTGASSSSGVSLSTRGAARRERMQQELSCRRSQYFLQVQQQLFRTMFPSQQVPQSEAELVGAGATMTAYLEKHGGYKHQKEQGMALWIAAHALDSAMMGDHHGCREFLAILIVCLEQAAHDGSWNVAYLLSLLESPPNGVFTERVQTMPGIDRPFSPLVPQPWAACALAYIKEMDILTNKKSELRGAGRPKPQLTNTPKTPSPRYCHVMPANPSSCQRRQCHVSRVLHTMVMALNFWHSGGRFIEASSLQRAPNRLHRVLYRRIRSLLKSDGPALAFETTKAGRRFPELVPRLSELSSVLTFNGASGDPYDKTFPGVEVVKDDTVMPELQPYRDLDPDRLLLFGTGHFDATEFLDDALTMPYRDPDCLSIDVPPGSRPNIRDSPETVCKLASVWDKQNLLTIHREHVNPDKYVRVFNAYKSTSQDRQIGDRRGANSLEARISDFGPSSQLPAGSDLAELSLNPRKQTLSITITDRKDFYHQFWCSKRKTIGNTIGPPVETCSLQDCSAYGLFLQEYANKRYDRAREGKIIGAWVNADDSTRRRGLATFSAPPQKRLGLSHVSLAVSSLTHTSDSLHLCLVGGWVSAMGYRRPMYSLFKRAFGLVDTSCFDPNHPKLIPLPRLVAQELVLASVLHPLMLSDLGAVYHDRIFATDASQHKGAICSMAVSPDLAEIVWKTSRSKGSYTRLQTPSEILLKRLGVLEEQDVLGALEADCSPTRPLAYRSKMVPYGFQPREPKTRLGNQLAGRACQVFYIAAINHVAALLETTYSSLLKHLPFWKSAASLPGARQTRVDSCRFGSPHLKSFRIMLSVHVKPDHMDKRCQCTQPHIQVQGKYTKASATYTDLLAEAIALDFEIWIRSEKLRVAEEAYPDSKGLESVGVNNLAISGDWSVDTAWTFRKESHINILEEAVVLRLAQRCSKFGFPTRVTAMVDSNVVRGATSKGRSSSISLSTVLRRFNAICVAAALYFNIPFCPTRLNVADDPTRDRPLRSKSPGIDFSKLSRDELFDIFSHHKLKRWAANWARLIIRGIDLDALLENSHVWVEEINILLCRFGRQLFEAGKTYNQYAETINSITSIRPSLRRQMQGAWDLGYAWMRQEPSQHHLAMPGVVLLSMITTALMWGRVFFAGCLALGWGSLLRPGEIFNMQRRNLLFPSDGGFSVSYCLVSLMEPKTRFTAARHQCTRLDIPDLLQVAVLAFEKMDVNRYIWPYSPQTFRNRFKAALTSIGLPTSPTPSLKALDPGSLRAGGASWLMQVTDSGDIVRRRGRWQNSRIMEVYVQEVSSLIYLQFLDSKVKSMVLDLASHFTAVLERAQSLYAAKIPYHIWYVLFSR
eukprot:symbB.v1.2.030438.t1/scaffold3423.1/size57148/1